MAQIVQTLSKKRLQLGIETFLRPMVWGTNWRVIRIGLLCGMADIFASPDFNPQLLIGITAGNTYGWDSPFIVDAIAQQIGGTSWGVTNYSRVTNTGQPAYNIAGCIAARKQGAVITPTSGNSANTGVFAMAGSGIYTGVSVLITKFNPGYRFDLTASPTAVSFNTSDLAACLENTSVSPSWATIAGNTVSYSNSSHPFDTVMVYWSRSVPTFEIAEIMVTRIM